MYTHSPSSYGAMENRPAFQFILVLQFSCFSVDWLIWVDVVEDLPGIGEEVIDVVDVSPPSLKLLLGVQGPCVPVHHRVVHA